MLVNLDEATGELYTADGEHLCSLGEILPAGTDNDEDDDPRPYTPQAGLSETLINKQTTFNLPKVKKSIEDALWIMFSGGIHQSMSNTSNPKQCQRAMDLMHASIVASMVDRDVAKSMTISDYIQLHHFARNLIARSVTFEGDHLRDATLLGRTLNPGVVDSLRFSPESRKSGGGFFGFLKK